MSCDCEFDKFAELLDSLRDKLFILNIVSVDLSFNTPPDIASQIIMKFARQNASEFRGEPIEIEILIVSIESSLLVYA
jgi:hypothetical protein